MLVRELWWAVAGLWTVLVGGVIGYRYLEGWSWLDSVWMVVITLTTIGYGEVHHLSDEGRAFTIGMIVLGVGLGGYTVTRLTRHVIEGDLVREFKQRRRRRIMRKLSDHYIVVGYGRLGQEVASELSHAQRDVVIIDPDEKVIEDAPDDVTMVIVGDGASDEMLNQAALERAAGIAVATPSSALNVFITLSARQMNERVHIITRVDDQEGARKAIKAGANGVVAPFGIGGARMAQGLLRPHTAHFVERATGAAYEDFSLEDIQIGQVDAYNGPLERLGIPMKHRVLVVAVRKPDGRLITAVDRAAVLEPGDIAVVVGDPVDIRGFATAAAGPRSAADVTAATRLRPKL